MTSRQVLEELVRRSRRPPPDFLRDTFPQQREFLLDESPLKAAHCSRGAAKSYTAGLGIYRCMQQYPDCSIFYATKTRDMARNIMWEMVLKPIARDFAVPMTFNESLLEGRHANGSRFRLVGLDNDRKQMLKLLGGKYKLVVLDEAAFFDQDLATIIYTVLLPATGRVGGSVWILSTSSDFTQGLFYEITRPEHELRTPGWSVHEWQWWDNPYVRESMQATVDRLVAAQPGIVNTPHYKQHYLNQWVIDDSNLVYRYDPARNSAAALPPVNGFQHVLGVDLGFSDATAFVVLAYHPNLPSLFVVDVIKRTGMDLTDVSNKIHELDLIYDFEHKVVDGANKQAVAEMNNRHGTDLGAADKREKFEHQQLLNADLIMGNIKLLPAAAPLAREWQTLLKHPDDPKKEHPGCENHAADACLYGWRRAYNYLARPERAVPKPGTTEWIHNELNRMERRAEVVQERKQREDSWEPAALDEPDWGAW